MIKIKCTKSISFGLFSIDKGSVWILKGIKYSNIPQAAIVQIAEYKDNGIWAEISQDMLAQYFENVDGEAA